MPSFLARCIGLAGGPELPPGAAMLLAERHGRLSRNEAKVVVKDYLGASREELSEALEVSTDSIRTYWKRIYRKTGCHNKEEVREWLEKLLKEALGLDETS